MLQCEFSEVIKTKIEVIIVLQVSLIFKLLYNHTGLTIYFFLKLCDCFSFTVMNVYAKFQRTFFFP